MMDIFYLLTIPAILFASSMTLFQFCELLQRYGIKMPLGMSSWLLALLSTLGYGYMGWYYEAWGQVLLCMLSTIIISLIIWKDGVRKVQEKYTNYHCHCCGSLVDTVDDPAMDFIRVVCPGCGELVCTVERPLCLT